MNDNTLNITEAAKTMNVHPQTVLDLIGAGAIPAAKVGRAYVMLTRDVMAFVENAIIRQTAERMGGVPRRRPHKGRLRKTTSNQ